jgi:hypothetical protein
MGVVDGGGGVKEHSQPSRQHLRDTVNSVSPCIVRAARGRGVSPLTPYPSPRSGERGARGSFRKNFNAIGRGPVAFHPEFPR